MRSSISKEMLQFMGENASDANEAAHLKRLATNRREYNLWKMNHLGIVDLFENFPSIMVDASGFVYRLKPIQPRYFILFSRWVYWVENKCIMFRVLAMIYVHTFSGTTASLVVSIILI